MSNVISLFDEIGMTKGDKPCVDNLSFAQFDALVERLAFFLVRHGLPVSFRGIILLERSPNFLVAAFGVLKAGGAYVPVDPHQGIERIRRIFDDCAADALVCSQSTLPEGVHFDGLIVDIDRLFELSEPTEGIRLPDIQPSMPAYVIYTSGTTGTPKGVVITHRNLWVHIHAYQQLCPTLDTDCALITAPFTFDVSVYEIFTALPFGASVHILPRQQLTDMPALVQTIREHNISLLYLPPQVVEVFALYLRRHELHLPLRRLLVGVEPIRQTVLDAIYQRMPGGCIFNGYGPTEATVSATAELFEGIKTQREIVSIGKPLPGYKVLLLNNDLKPVADGQVGQIAIGGEAVSPGYLFDEELTAKKFVKGIDSQAPDERYYLTGDLAFKLPDGNLEFAGRSDFQTKIKGYRVEPAEVDAALLSIPQVLKTCTLVVETAPRHKALFSFFLAEEEIPDIKALLGKKLPDYMVPDFIRRLEHFPLNHAGKTDRLALEKLALQQLAEMRDTLNENQPDPLEAIYRKNLPAAHFDPGSSYYRLGGDSIGVMVLAADVSEKFGVTISPEWIGQQGSLNALREKIRVELSTFPENETQLITGTTGAKTYPATPAQSALYFLHQIEGLQLVYNIFFRIGIKGNLNIDILQKVIRHIVNSHDLLRGRLTLNEGKLFWVIEEAPDVDIHLLSPGRDPDDLAYALSRMPFQPDRAPLFRFHLLPRSAEHHILFFNIHHSIFDGWSAGIFMNALKHAYPAALKGEDVSFDHPASYHDFVLYQQDCLNKGLWKEDVNYWHRKFDALPEPLFDLHQHKPDFSHGRRYSWVLPLSTVELLKNKAKDLNTSLFVLLIAPYYLTLFHHTGKRRGTVATIHANRQTTLFRDTIGYFTNIVALSAEASDGHDLDGFVHQLSIDIAEAFAHARYPYDLLVKEKGLARRFDENPVYQCFFIFQNWIQPILGERDEAKMQEDSPAPDLNPRYNQVSFDFTESGSHTAKAILTMDCSLRHDGLECWLEYPTNLFPTERIEEMVRQYNQFVQLIIEKPGMRIAELAEQGLLPAAKLEPQSRSFSEIELSGFHQPTPQEASQASRWHMPGLQMAYPTNIHAKYRLPAFVAAFLSRVFKRPAIALPVLKVDDQQKLLAHGLLQFNINHQQGLSEQLPRLAAQIYEQLGGIENATPDADKTLDPFTGAMIENTAAVLLICPDLTDLSIAAFDKLPMLFCVDAEKDELLYRGFRSGDTSFFESNQLLRSMEAYLLRATAGQSGMLKVHYLSDDHSLLLAQQCKQTKQKLDEPQITVMELFQAFAANNPDRPAVISEDEQMAYGALDAISNRIAASLLSICGDREGPVGLLMNRSVACIAVIMAVLKSGKAYLPLDPRWPPARVQEIIDDAKPAVVVSDTAAHAQSGLSDVRFTTVDELHTISTAGITFPVVHCDDDAYIIYTSGSTGRPKGVVVSHRGLSSFTIAAIGRYSLSGSDVLLQFASLSFDAAVEEVFGALCSGAQLVLRNDDMIVSASDFLNFLLKYKITILDLPTAFWVQTMQSVWAEGLSFHDELRLVIIGGEKAPWPVVNHWKKHIGNHPKLINTYGPTETTVVVTTCYLHENKTSDAFALGYPLGDNCIVVLDENLQPLPDGLVGELAVAGPQLAKGYLNRAEITTEKFVNIHDDWAGGLRFYLTGDLVLKNKDGQFIFYGRKDNQLKIRGYRIEPDEINRKALQFEGVLDAYTMMSRGGERSILTTYVLVQNPMHFNKHHFMDFLRDGLPEYMLPAAVLPLDHFPTTPNMKVDVDALPDSFSDRNAPHAKTESLSGEQANVAQIFEKVLGVSNCSPKSNFFSLGGDSLMVLACLSEIKKQSGKALTIAEFYQNATVESLANLLFGQSISAQENKTLPPELVCLKNGRAGANPVFTVYLDRANSFLPDLVPAESPVYTFLPEGSDGERITRRSVRKMAEHYVEIIKNYFDGQTITIFGYSFGGLVAAEMAAQLSHHEQKIDRLLLIDTNAPWVWRKVYPKTIGLRDRWKDFKHQLRILPLLVLGKPIPEKKRNAYIRHVWFKAAVRYVPTKPAFPVKLILVMGAKGRLSIPSLGWDREQNFDVETLQFDCNHHELVRDKAIFESIISKAGFRS